MLWPDVRARSVEVGSEQQEREHEMVALQAWHVGMGHSMGRGGRCEDDFTSTDD